MFVKIVIAILFGVITLFTNVEIHAQALPHEAQQLEQKAFESRQRGDYTNAIALYSQAIRLAPSNVGLRRDLAYVYFLMKDFAQAQEVLNPVLKSELADEQTYQLGSAIELALDKVSRAKKVINEGLAKFPNSGLLYNNKGNIVVRERNGPAKAIAEWQKGISVEPLYGMNYFNAAKYYYQQKQYVWALLYGEIFVNLERTNARTIEIKKLVWDSYKQFFATQGTSSLPSFDQQKEKTKVHDFEGLTSALLLKHANVFSLGINTESLTMLRSKMIMEWKKHYESFFPFTLWSYMDRLMVNGHFDAYNQWLFGATEDSQSFTNWVKKFQKKYKAMEQYIDKNPMFPASSDPSPSGKK